MNCKSCNSNHNSFLSRPWCDRSVSELKVEKLEENNKYKRQLLEFVLIESNMFKGTEAFDIILNLIRHELGKEKKYLSALDEK